MKIKQASINDLDAIIYYAVKIASQHQAFNPIRYSTFPEHPKLLKEYFKSELASDKTIISLLCVNEEVVGYSLVKMDEDNLEQLALSRAWLHDIFIDEKARGSGGGKMLLNASKSAAIKLGSTILMLHVAIENVYAKKFFEDSGFVTTSTEMMFPLD